MLGLGSLMVACGFSGEPRGAGAQAGACGPISCAQPRRRRAVWPAWVLALSLVVPFVVHAADAGADLTALSLEQLLETPIVGASKYEQKPADVASAARVISRQDIQTFGWRTLGEALASLPGVYITYDRQYQYVGMRGFGLPGDLTARVLIMVNGNRINDPVYDGAPAGQDFPLDLDLIERIEFIPGPGGAVYGQNAMFGVVNVITRTGASLDGAEVSVGFQHPNTSRKGRASFGKLLDNGLDVLVSISGLSANGKDRYYDYGSSGISGVAAGLDSERDQEFFARVSLGAWSAEVLQSDRSKRDPTAAYFSDPLVRTQPYSDRYAIGQLQYQDRFADGTLQLSGRVFAGRYRFDAGYSYGTLFSEPARADWHGTEWHVVSTAVAGHKLMVGLEAQDNTHIEQETLDLAQPANDRRIDSAVHRIGVFAQDEWRLADTLSATLGVRADRSSHDGTRLSPRTALIWQPTTATTMKLLYGRAHRSPNAYERDYSDGESQAANPSLRGESVDAWEAVVDHRYDHELAVRASLYRWTTQHLIALGMDPVSGLSQYQSGGSIRSQGLELSADKVWASGARLRGSVSLQDVDNPDGGRLPNSPQTLGKLNLSVPLGWGWQAGYEFQADSQRMSLAGSDLGGYAVSNLTLGTARLANGVELWLSVHNLFDRRYAHPGSEINWQNSLEQDGRSASAKLVVSF